MIGGGVSDVEALTPVGAADRAAEALRALNDLMLAAPAARVPGWEGVDDIYRVLGELRIITDRLPQVCDQLVAGLQRLGEQRAWRTDEGTREPPGAGPVTPARGGRAARVRGAAAARVASAVV